jgi:hypothetical protein
MAENDPTIDRLWRELSSLKSRLDELPKGSLEYGQTMKEAYLLRRRIARLQEEEEQAESPRQPDQAAPLLSLAKAFWKVAEDLKRAIGARIYKSLN